MAFEKLKSLYYVYMANGSFRAGDQKEALTWLEKAYKTGSAKPGIVITYGYLLLKNGQLEESIKILKEQLSKPNLANQDYYNAKSNYGLALWKKGQLEDAIKLYEEIIPKFKTTNMYGNLGYLYNLKGDLETALKFNLEAFEYNDASGIILDNLGQTYYLLGDFEKANEIFKKLMNLNPKFPEAFYDYALVLEKLGDREKCLEKLRNALVYKPNYLSALTAEQIEQKLAAVEKEQEG